MDGAVDSIGAARERVRMFLSDAARPIPDGVAQAVLLAVSELVTNAVLHAPGPYTLAISVDDRCVHIAVTDTSRIMPAARAARLDGSGGLGLHLLEALAGRVDVDAHQQGKTVSVDIAV